MMIKTKIISSAETHPLRRTVLWPHKNSLDECTIDIDDAKDTFHVGVFYNDSLVSIGTFMVDTNKIFNIDKQYRLRAMATSPNHRRQNFGKQVIDFAIKELKNQKTEILWCNARKVAIGFYEKRGFKTIGDYFDIPIIGKHKIMYLKF